MVRHKAIGKHVDAFGPAARSENREIGAVVFGAKEHLLTTIAALRSVMRDAGRDRSCQTSRART